MSRIWTRASVRIFAVFILVGGLIAGAYFGLNRGDDERTTQVAVQYVGDPVNRIDEQQAQHDAVNGYRQRQMREEASRSAKRDARDKAADGGANAAQLSQDADDAKKDSEHKTDSYPGVDVPSSCKEYSGNKATGCALMLQAGYKIDQMGCLAPLWDRESGWNPHAANGSGAYGIPQAKPGDKMAAYGDDWQDNPATQIKWGLQYIKDRYGSPCDAWQHSQDTGWY